MAFMSCFTEAAAAEADSVASFDGLDIRLCRPGTPLLKPLWFMSPVVNRRILSVGGQVRSGNGSLWLGGREKDKLQVHCTLINYYMQCLFRFTPVLCLCLIRAHNIKTWVNQIVTEQRQRQYASSSSDRDHSC